MWSIIIDTIGVLTVIIIYLRTCQICDATDTVKVCNTPACIQLGRTLRKSMNPQVEPCTDFYNYVCQNWGTQNSRLKDVQAWNVENLLDYKVMCKLRMLLEDKEVSKSKYIQNCKTLYRTCMNLPYFDKANATMLQHIMSAVRGPQLLSPRTVKIPEDYPFSDLDTYYIMQTGESAFFDFQVVANLLDRYQIIGKIKPLVSPYGMVIRNMDWKGTEDLMNYKAFLLQAIQTVLPQIRTPFDRQLLEDLDLIIDFRRSLFEAIYKSPGMYQEMTVSELELWHKRRTIHPFNWQQKISNLYKNSRDAYRSLITSKTELLVNQAFLAYLSSLLEMTPIRVIVNHIHLYFLERHVALSTDMQRYLANSIIHDDYVAGKIRYEPPRWRYCVINNNMLQTMGQMYVRSSFSVSDRTAIEKLDQDAKRLLKQQIIESNWLNSEAKNLSMTMIDQIKTVIGYPDWYKVSEVNMKPEKYDLNPLSSDAYFHKKYNSISISAAYLQPPIYSRNMPYVVNYGSIVSLLGHELYHRFDHDGLKQLLPKTESWWPKDMYDEYNTQSKCFADKYAKFKIDEIHKHKMNMTVPLSVTVDEDISDVMGLKLAYKGFRQIFNQQKGVCEVLPGFERDGCEKLFFVSFAASFCSDSSDEINKRVLAADKHSLQNIRVNGAVGNMPEFTTAFGCKTNDLLNFKDRCDIWKK